MSNPLDEIFKDVKLPDGVTKSDLERALSLLEREKKTIAKTRERKANDPEYAKARKLATLKQNIKRQILLQKAEDAGITATEEEITAELQRS